MAALLAGCQNHSDRRQTRLQQQYSPLFKTKRKMNSRFLNHHRTFPTIGKGYGAAANCLSTCGVIIQLTTCRSQPNPGGYQRGEKKYRTSSHLFPSADPNKKQKHQTGHRICQRPRCKCTRRIPKRNSKGIVFLAAALPFNSRQRLFTLHDRRISSR